ncbi:LytTR family transcriptional regulator DNA-binding domain-containing protein [Leadbetterella byssophila]|jgi:DNA-binding LytR/AlgR family response regulator|uniref:LytTr DNA-binding region n=1 Tax=Leadbetterella byssophila (strain DSM 17132 / JCM 16389 / KACC 11308 / NBRC 106382 / 4M15) TaxID=649349 RepID=E4RYY5_LEAB4|nr:LytTR family transcriptional regulator DNA-binding domain-containing protein [Leadbetterella byssophila]ADQ18204.1 LytTr DNA-binding region [Leadbetterella byssophila DSM 17132]
MKKENYNSREVMFLSGDINYTEIYLINGEKMVSSSTLLRHEEKLDSFIRVSKKHLVNPEYVCGYELQGKYMQITLQNGDHMKVSRRRVKTVLSSIMAATA